MADVINLPGLKLSKSPLEEFGRLTFLNPREISGGATALAFRTTAKKIEEFIAEGGSLLPIVCGEHIIGGSVLVHRRIAGSPAISILYIALGDGQGNGGGRGEWEGAVAVYYNGAAQSVSADATTAGYRFHAGAISTGVASGPQQVDAFLPDNIAYSGTVYYAIKLTDTDANAGDTPQKLRGRFKGRKFLNFNAGGISLGSIYSVNAALFAADRVLAYCDHKFPGNAAAALAKLQGMIEWDSWIDWRDFNGALISWNNGISTVNIPRFQCHMAFLEDVKLDEALNQICASSGAHWQVDGRQIVFFPPTEREPVHHFDESNIIDGSIRVEPRDPDQRPNIYEATYRDTDDTFLGLTATPAIRREALIRQAGKIKASRSFPNMPLSQAQRLLERQARLEADNPVIVALVGDENSIDVQSGEFVTMSHKAYDWNYQRFLVLETVLQSAEDGADLCEFVLQKIDDILYSDTAHGPKQQKLSELNPTTNTTPDTVQGGSAVTSPSNTGHGSTNVLQVGAGSTTKSIIWTAFAPVPGGTLTAVSLKFNWSEDGSIANGGTSGFRVQYSTNGGGAWTTALEHFNVTSPTTSNTTVVLSTSQDLTQVQVRGRLQAGGGGVGDSASLTASVSNIRIEVEFS